MNDLTHQGNYLIYINKNDEVLKIFYNTSKKKIEEFLLLV